MGNQLCGNGRFNDVSIPQMESTIAECEKIIAEKDDVIAELKSQLEAFEMKLAACMQHPVMVDIENVHTTDSKTHEEETFEKCSHCGGHIQKRTESIGAEGKVRTHDISMLNISFSLNNKFSPLCR